VPLYKFLSSGARTPFAGIGWPPPSDAPGEWVGPDDPAADAPGGSRVCLVDHLPHWVADELWVVEIDGARREGDIEVVAERVRLLAKVDGWDPATARAWAAAAAWRARDAVTTQLSAHGHADVAIDLHAAVSLADLVTRATALSEEIRPRSPTWADAVGLVGEVGHEAEHAWVATALQTSVVAAGAGWDPVAQAAERQWQARWLAARLGLAD
jgi:hypothetical protein